MNPKAHAISGLMQQLKSGEISKAELFQQLSKLQPSTPEVPAEAPPRQTLQVLEPDRAGVSHDQAKIISVHQLLASRLAAERSPVVLDAPKSIDSIGRSFYVPATYQESSSGASSLSDDANPACNEAYEATSPQRYVQYLDEDSFHVRVSRWKQQKESLKERLKQEQLESELVECTFSPAINSKSKKVASRLRSRSTDTVSDRLYKDVVNYKLRDELAVRAREQEDEDRQRECTFRPHVTKSAYSSIARSKYKEKAYKKFAPDVPTLEMEQCTFSPKINAIPKDMVSAQLYTQQNIFDRLSRPLTGYDGVDEHPSMLGGSSSGGSLLSESVHSQDDIRINRGHHAGQGKPRPNSAGSARTDDSAEVAARQRRFEAFVHRQEAKQRERHAKLESARHRTEFDFKPEINKKSIEIMQQGRKGDFIERVAKYALRKEHDKLKKKSIKLQDPQCTFRPQINEASMRRAGRSVTELSRGDLLKRETSQRLMKLKMEQGEMAQLTFRPQVNDHRGEGKLKVLSSPETYVQRLQEQTLKLYEKQRKALQQQEIQEFRECTFKPRTKEVPGYISRIAKSMEIAKAMQNKNAKPRVARPEWK
ncbi:hypothetical protein SDRG_11155 [Saprolegnia diclina VS20]|uniref:Uncharacterized protein n=1 Tax=Saprolegnia diclina (strain VS20) TaxID=1156394 RepID=T0RMP0_SAPDV|nr:hypothetical protein SDRG_11155 [Saprolegnia diclina VS20]EQC31232.1 hypothetical protein SDRG_11155 [Saprolegnia diclina VS20]|eukprot:XP_008615405.1 hypothetical protein SDRG_11155 [Saprolegnia diclina VS20]